MKELQEGTKGRNTRKEGRKGVGEGREQGRAMKGRKDASTEGGRKTGPNKLDVGRCLINTSFGLSKEGRKEPNNV
jgi:hypothetical protein